jgi:hypothetical protein
MRWSVPEMLPYMRPEVINAPNGPAPTLDHGWRRERMAPMRTTRTMVLVLLMSLACPAMAADDVRGVEIEAGVGASVNIMDGVGAPAAWARVGYRFGEWDLSGRFDAVLGPRNSFNTDCCATSYSYHAWTGFVEGGYLMPSLPFRIFAGVGISSAMMLAREAGQIAGESHGSPAFELGLQYALWSTRHWSLSAQIASVLWTGVGSSGGVDHVAHDSVSFGLSPSIALGVRL